MRRLILAAFLLSAAGCKNKTVDVAPIAAEDESLRKNESDLMTQRGALQRERKKLSDARAEIIERRTQLGHDSTGQSALDEEEKKLLTKESDLTSQEAQVNSKLDELLKMRGDLVKRATQVVATAPGADPLERAAKREQSVASREREMAERERDVSQREKELGLREAVLAKRERDTCGAVAVPAKVELPKGLHYSSRDVEPIYRKALKLMQERGLLTSDLPPGTGKLVEDTRETMKKGDYVRAKYDADQLLATVEEIRIDRSFISAKMARLSAAMRGKKLEGGDRKTVEELFQEATSNYGDGKFPQANLKINKLFALLKAG
ncbi:MAG: hypothetical protein JWN44_5693 [Myxococcales bacterium]|nr:hypothetical protein [Myxococcales bacterium]